MSGLNTMNPIKALINTAMGQELAMDLGTANTLIYIKGKGVLLNEPSLVAMEDDNPIPLAVGQAAKDMYGRTSHSVKCIRPLKDGVIADFKMTSILIKHMINKVIRRCRLSKPRLTIGIPSGITQVEKRAVIDAAIAANTRDVHLVEEPMAAALGLNLPVDQPIGNMIVDIGGGTTEVAIISSNATIYSHSIRVAGDVMNEAIQRCIKRNFDLQIGIMEAERLKVSYASALPASSTAVTVYGRDLVRCLPKKIEIDSELIRETLDEPINVIISSIITALEQTNPDIARDIIARGVYLTGGGSLLSGLAERLYQETGIQFFTARDPLTAVVCGVGRVIENLKENQIFCVA